MPSLPEKGGERSRVSLTVGEPAEGRHPQRRDPGVSVRTTGTAPPDVAGITAVVAAATVVVGALKH